MRTLDYHDHRRELGANRYVYAVVSRRAQGLSIGINLNPNRICNFNCPYCQVDRTTAVSAAEVDLARLDTELDALLDLAAAGTLWDHPPFDTTDPALRRVADIAFSGDGEPTASPAFPESARRARRFRNAHGMSVPLRLLTNATLLDRPAVQSALDDFDELWCKLDAGTPEHFARVAGTRFPFSRILSNLRETACRRPIVIQSLFFAFGDESPSAGEVQAYVSRLAEIRDAGGQIDRVQVITVARRPADPEVQALAEQDLELIAAAVRGAGFAVEVHPAPAD